MKIQRYEEQSQNSPHYSSLPPNFLFPKLFPPCMKFRSFLILPTTRSPTPATQLSTCISTTSFSRSINIFSCGSSWFMQPLKSTRWRMALQMWQKKRHRGLTSVHVWNIYDILLHYHRSRGTPGISRGTCYSVGHRTHNLEMSFLQRVFPKHGVFLGREQKLGTMAEARTRKHDLILVLDRMFCKRRGF